MARGPPESLWVILQTTNLSCHVWDTFLSLPVFFIALFVINQQDVHSSEVSRLTHVCILAALHLWCPLSVLLHFLPAIMKCVIPFYRMSTQEVFQPSYSFICLKNVWRNNSTPISINTSVYTSHITAPVYILFHFAHEITAIVCWTLSTAKTQMTYTQCCVWMHRGDSHCCRFANVLLMLRLLCGHGVKETNSLLVVLFFTCQPVVHSFEDVCSLTACAVSLSTGWLLAAEVSYNKW